MKGTGQGKARKLTLSGSRSETEASWAPRTGEHFYPLPRSHLESDAGFHPGSRAASRFGEPFYPPDAALGGTGEHFRGSQ